MLKAFKNGSESKKIELTQDQSKLQELENMMYKYKRWCDDCPHNDYEESCGHRLEKCEEKKAELVQKIKALRKELDDKEVE